MEYLKNTNIEMLERFGHCVPSDKLELTYMK